MPGVVYKVEVDTSELNTALPQAEQKLVDVGTSATDAMNQASAAAKKAAKEIGDAHNYPITRAQHLEAQQGKLTAQLAEFGLDGSGAVLKVEKSAEQLRHELLNVQKEGAQTGAKLVGAFVPGVDVFGELASKLAGSGGVMLALGGVGAAVGLVVAGLEQWMKEEERAEQAARSHYEAELRFLEDTKKAIIEKKKVINEAALEEIAMDLQMRESRQRYLKDQLDAVNTEMRNLKLSNSEREELIERRQLLELQIADNAVNIKKVEEAKKLALERATNKEAATEAQRVADKIREIEAERAAGRLAAIKREEAFVGESHVRRIELMERVADQEDYIDRKKVAHLSEVDQRLAETRIANRRREVEFTIEQIKREELERRAAAEREQEELNRRLTERVNNAKLGRAGSENQVLFDEGQEIIDLELAQAAAVREVQAARIERAASVEGTSHMERIAAIESVNAIRDAEAAAALQRRIQQIELLRYTSDHNEEYIQKRIRLEKEAAEVEKQARREAADFAVAMEKRKQEEIDRTRRETLALAYAQEANAAASMLVTAVTGPLVSKMAELGELNRDNAREFFEFGEDAPAVAAKVAQGVLAGLAAEAAGRAIMKGLEYAGAVGTGAVMLAMGNPQGSAVIQAATPLALTAAGYAAFAGTSAGGAFALGMSRGGGGVVGLTKEERDARDASSGGGGPARLGGSSSASDGSRPIIRIEQNYHAGSIAPSDDKRATDTVVRGVRRGMRDGYARLLMQG